MELGELGGTAAVHCRTNPVHCLRDERESVKGCRNLSNSAQESLSPNWEQRDLSNRQPSHVVYDHGETGAIPVIKETPVRWRLHFPL